jgi:hypothetical protein
MAPAAKQTILYILHIDLFLFRDEQRQLIAPGQDSIGNHLRDYAVSADFAADANLE